MQSVCSESTSSTSGRESTCATGAMVTPNGRHTPELRESGQLIPTGMYGTVASPPSTRTRHP